MRGSMERRDRPQPYLVRWRDNQGKQHSRTFRRKKDAEVFLARVVGTVHDGTFQATRPISVSDLFDQWISDSLEVRLRTGELKPSTAKSYRSMIATHLRPAFGRFRSDRLSPADLARWARGMADRIGKGELSPRTYNHLHNLLRSVLGWARHPAQAFLSTDPMVGMTRLPQPKVERDFLEPEEIRALIAAATPPDSTIIHLAAYTGIRRGELFAVQWQDVDWGNGRDGGRLFIRRSIFQGAVSSPKTEHSIRVVDVPQRTLDELNVYRTMFPPIDPGFIFRQPAGKPLDPDNWRNRRWPRILEAAGVRRIGLHSLRHSYASMLIAQNEPLAYVSRQLGHASIATTVNVYGHMLKATSLEAMRRLEQTMDLDANTKKARESLPGGR